MLGISTIAKLLLTGRILGLSGSMRCELWARAPQPPLTLPPLQQHQGMIQGPAVRRVAAMRRQCAALTLELLSLASGQPAQHTVITCLKGCRPPGCRMQQGVGCQSPRWPGAGRPRTPSKAHSNPLVRAAVPAGASWGATSPRGASPSSRGCPSAPDWAARRLHTLVLPSSGQRMWTVNYTCC